MTSRDPIVLDDGVAGSIAVSDADDGLSVYVSPTITVSHPTRHESNGWLMTPEQVAEFGSALVLRYGMPKILRLIQERVEELPPLPALAPDVALRTCEKFTPAGWVPWDMRRLRRGDVFRFLDETEINLCDGDCTQEYPFSVQVECYRHLPTGDAAPSHGSLRDGIDKVAEFHRRFEAPIGPAPGFIGPEREKLRVGFIEEELKELRDALAERDLAEVLDALGDLAYVVFGMAIEMGLPLAQAFDEIHRSNMTKLGQDGKPVRRPDGKVMKGEHYEPPQIAAILRQRGYEAA